MINPIFAPVVVDRDHSFSAQTRWIHGEGTPNLSHPMYRRSFTLSAVPKQAVMLIMSANYAQVFINGAEAAMHVVRNYVFDTIYEVYDITSFLRPGNNTVAVRNINASEPKQVGFALEIQADGETVCRTDGNWRWHREEALAGPVNYHISGGGDEVVDGARLLDDFADPALDDSDWTPVQVIGDGVIVPPCDRIRQSRMQGQTANVCFPKELAAVMHTSRAAGCDITLHALKGGSSLGMTVMTADRDGELMLVAGDSLRGWAIDGVRQPKNAWIHVTAGRHFVGFAYVGNPDVYIRTEIPLSWNSPTGTAAPLMVYGLREPMRKYPWNEYRGPSEAQRRADALLTVDAYEKMPSEVLQEAVPTEFGQNQTVIHQIRSRAYCVPANGFAQQRVYKDHKITNSDIKLNFRNLDNLFAPDGEAVIGVNDGGVNLVLDFGEEKVGRVAFEADAPAGTVLDIHCFEMINDTGIHYMGGPMTLRYICKAGAQEYVSRRRRGFRYLSLTVSGNTGEVRLKNIRVIEHRYPTEAGDFRCSDARLNQIYQMSVRTAELCMLESYVDCPGYEQNAWTGDARVTAQVNLCNFGAYELDQQYLKLIAQSIEDGVCRCYREENPRYLAGMFLTCASHPTYPEGCIPVWSFQWILHVYDHYQCTGNKNELAEVFYAVKENLSRCEKMTDDRGLFDMQGAWNLIEWANNDLDFYGEVTANNVMLSYCFGRAAEMAEILDDPTLAAHYRRQQTAYRDAVNRYCWSEQDQAYVDTVRDAYAYKRYCDYIDRRNAAMRRRRKAGTPPVIEKISYEDYLKKGRISVQSNTMAILYDAAPAERRNAAMRFLLDNVKTGVYVSGTPANRTTGTPSEEEAPGGYVHIGSPFFMFFALEVLYRYGYDRLALDTQRNAWGEILDSGINTCLETFKKDDDWTRSIAHAWSASPAIYLVREVLGVHPVKPGFAEFTVTPKTDGLDHAEGSVSTPRGRIHVSWKKDADGTVHITCNAPEGCKRV